MVQIYITHVQDFGPFLKIFGQTNKAEAIKIEKAIRQLTPILNTIPQLQELHIGAICLGKYSDGNYYRSRITGIGVNGLINIFFLDYGNEDVIHWFEVRLLNLENPFSTFLKNVQPQASVFILARSIDKWKPQVLEYIRAEISNENFEAKIETKVIGFDIISFKFKGQDYSESIFRRKFCNKITIEQQLDMILMESRQVTSQSLAPMLPSQINNNFLPFYHALPQNQLHMPSPIMIPSMPNHLNQTRPNAPSVMLKPQTLNHPFINNQQVRGVTPLFYKKYTRFIKSQEINQQQIATKLESQPVSNLLSSRTPTISSSSSTTSSSNNSTKTEVATFKSATLNVGTTHEVYCSYVEDGPNLFSIQLAANKFKLTELMRALYKILEKSRLKHLSGKPSLGMACIIHDIKNQRFYRAVIMSISTKSCQVVYVDYGQTEYVTYQCIYEIPVQFLKQEVFAMKFALSGYNELQPITDLMRNQFKEMVLNKKLFLKVKPLEGEPFVQYCELYDGKKNILTELQNASKTKITKQIKTKLKYAAPRELQKGNSYTITIRYVESPQRFFVQLVDYVADYDSMMDRLWAYCKHAPPMTEYNVGDICAAKFDDNEEEWYRVEITNIVNENRVCIRFVDFGNPLELDRKLLREISSEFETVPQQAIECVLKGFENLTNITDTARIQLEMFSEDERGERKQLYLTVVDELPNKVALVNLLDKSTTPPLNISRRMYVLSTPPKNFGAFQNDGNNNIKRGDTEMLNSTLVDKFNNNDLSPTRIGDAMSKTPSFNKKTDQNDTPKVFTRTNSSRQDTTSDSWKSNQVVKVNELDSWKSNSVIGPRVNQLDSWKSDSPPTNLNEVDSWKSNSVVTMQRHDGFDTTTDSWKLPINRNNDNRDMNKFSNNRNENFRSNNKNFSDNERTNQRYEINNSRGDKYINTKKLIPRFNKQLNNNNSNSNNNLNNNNNTNISKGTDSKFTKPNYEGKNLNTSESSGKFSWTSDTKRKSDQSTENSDGHNFPRSKSETPVEIEYVPTSTPYKKPIVKLNEKVQVQMQWWISPYHFYVQLNEHEGQFEAMVKTMQKFYRNRETILTKPNIGDSIVSCSQQCKIYCRATVLNYNEELNKYKIKLIDFGNTAIVTFENMWPLEKQFTILPQMAIRCSLTKGLLQTSIDHIMEVIGSYIPTQSHHQCEFKQEDNDIYTVDYFVNNNLLFDKFVGDELIVPLPDHININRLTGQTVLAKYKKIINFNEFYIQIDGFDITLPCSYPYGNKFNPNEMSVKIEEFKEIYENQFSPLKIEYVSEHFILLAIPLVPLLEEEKCPAICGYPILSNKYDVVVTAVESDNIVYAQLKESEHLVCKLLDDMFEYYENTGSGIEVAKEFSVCAAKSHDANWYRGLIQKQDETDETDVLIRYIDYGNTEKVPKTNLKILEEDFINLSALCSKIYLPISSTGSNVHEHLAKITVGYNLLFEPIDFIHDHWVGDLKFENHSIIDVLVGKELVNRVEINELEKQIEKDNEENVQHNSIKINNKLEEPIPFVEESNKATGSNTSNITKSIDTIDGYVAHVDNPESFYIQLESQKNSVNKLHENIQIIAQSLPQLDEFKKGTYCIAKYSVDEEWYRAKIIDFGTGVITIQFIDYGNADVITEQNKHLLKIMPVELKSTDPYAICCSLPVHPKDSVEWKEEATKAIYELVNCNVSFEYISKVGPKKYINLYHNNKDIGKFLVSNDYASLWDTIKTGEKCFISHCNSLSDFYIQLESDTNNLELISEYLNADIERFPILEEFNVGIICSAQFPEDEEWYRAKIIFHSDSGTEVLFIDYGNTAFTNNLRGLPSDIADLPILSKKCSLHLPNYISKWSEEAENQFNKMAAMGLTIFDVEMYAPGETITVNLYENGINIFKTLENVCQKHVIESMSESIVEEIFMSNEYMLNGYEGGIAHINSPNDFYVHFSKDYDALEELVDYLAKNGDQLDELKEKSEGKLCIAKFKEDNNFYRAKILTESNDGCDVLFVDYGNISFTNILKEIPETISNLEFFAKHCALRKFTSCYDNWNEKSSSYFAELCSSDETVFQINIVDETSDPYIVNLFLGNRNIHDEMEKIEIESDKSSHNVEVIKQCAYDLVQDICDNLNLDINTVDVVDTPVTNHIHNAGDEINLNDKE